MIPRSPSSPPTLPRSSPSPSCSRSCAAARAGSAVRGRGNRLKSAPAILPSRKWIKLRLFVETPVRPSEDEQKVRRALLNIFPDLLLRREGDRLVGEGSSMARFGDLIMRYRIRDAARGQLIHGKRGDDRTVFRLNKQAAFMDRVSFSEREAPLGDIRVRLEDDDIDRVIELLAPDTRPRSMRLAQERREPAKARSAAPKLHIRERLDPDELVGKDPLEED